MADWVGNSYRSASDKTADDAIFEIQRVCECESVLCANREVGLKFFLMKWPYFVLKILY